MDTGRIADLRPYFDSVPDPRARRGRWYSLTAILLVCACTAVDGDALDRAVGACLADRHRAATAPAQAPLLSAPGGHARSLSTAKHSRDQPVSPQRAGIYSPQSLTAPS
jgi:hypothetical protein